MLATNLFLSSILLSCVGAIISLFFLKKPNTSKIIGCVFGAFSALAGCGSGLVAMICPSEYVRVD